MAFEVPLFPTNGDHLVSYFDPGGSGFYNNLVPTYLPGNILLEKGGPVSHWRKKLKSNKDCITNLYAHDFIGQTGHVYLSGTNAANTSGVSQQIYALDDYRVGYRYSVVVTQLDYLLENAWHEHRGKCTQDLQKFYTGVFFLELRESLRLLRHPLESLGKLLAGFKARSFYMTADAAADAWLSYQLGAKPLLADISNIVSNILALIEDTEQARSVQSHNDEFTVTHGFSAFGAVGCPGYTERLTGVVDMKFSEEYFSVFQSVVNPVNSTTWQKYFGLRTEDIPATIWEAIPFSFVVDYFINIGDMLAECAFPSSEIAWAFTSRRALARCSHRPTGTVNATNINTSYGGSIELLFEFKERFRQDALVERFSHVDDGFGVLKLNVPSATQLTTMLALLVKLFLTPPK